MSDYARGWDDCLDTIKVIIQRSKDKEEINKKVHYLSILVKEKKFERIKVELGVFQDFF